MENRELDIGQGKKVFISYLNDDNETISGFVELLECDIFVVFKTGSNLIRLPSNRILKIKEKLE